MDTISLTGMVIGTMPMGEYDKRLLLLTKGAGKLGAFARGARRPNSTLIGASTLFAFGEFELIEGRSSYTVKTAHIREHFDFLSEDMEAMCYASYFAELADYYCRENVDAGKPLLLLYLALRSLERGVLPKPLVQCIYELKLMQLEGEYFPEPRGTVTEAVKNAWQYVLTAAPEKLFGFTLGSDDLALLRREAEEQKLYYIDRDFQSLRVLREMFG